MLRRFRGAIRFAKNYFTEIMREGVQNTCLPPDQPQDLIIQRGSLSTVIDVGPDSACALGSKECSLCSPTLTPASAASGSWRSFERIHLMGAPKRNSSSLCWKQYGLAQVALPFPDEVASLCQPPLPRPVRTTYLARTVPAPLLYAYGPHPTKRPGGR